jgi:hypothetical protein
MNCLGDGASIVAKKPCPFNLHRGAIFVAPYQLAKLNLIENKP